MADPVQIHVALPNHWAADAEVLWARPVDGGYEIRNPPFYAYGLSFLDVVAAEADGDGVLRVTGMVRRGGHETLRVILHEDVSNRARKKVTRELEALGVALEAAGERYLALDLPPEASMEAVRDLLDGFEEDGVLDYETANERVPGSFDDAPELRL